MKFNNCFVISLLSLLLIENDKLFYKFFEIKIGGVCDSYRELYGKIDY